MCVWLLWLLHLSNLGITWLYVMRLSLRQESSHRAMWVLETFNSSLLVSYILVIDKPFLGPCKVVHDNCHGAVGHHTLPTHLSQTIKLVLNQVVPYVELSWHPVPSVSPGGLVSIWSISQAVLPLVPHLSNPKLSHLQNWGSVVGLVWKCCTCALASCSQGLSNACLPWMDFLCEKANLCIWLARRGSFWMCINWHLMLADT